MNIVLEKNLDSGKYIINIEITAYTEDEIARIKKYGPPDVSITPKSMHHAGMIRSQVPITALNNMRFQFNDEDSAQAFAEGLKTKIKAAIHTLKTRVDEFSGRDEIEL